MKGIILAGGRGTRLFPLTKHISKQLLPLFDKPMVFYPLSTLISMGIYDILFIVRKDNIKHFKKLFGNGQHLGIKISYLYQDSPNGIAESFIIAEKFIGKENATLILGDNIYYGPNFGDYSFDLSQNFGCKIFICKVSNPESYGVVSFDRDKIESIEEKPKKPKTSYVVTGLYIYNNEVVEIAKKLKPSKRNELEVTDINNTYLQNRQLEYVKLSINVYWQDVGTPEALTQASEFMRSIQDRQDILIGSPELMALKKNFIHKKQLKKLINQYPPGYYRSKLEKIIY